MFANPSANGVHKRRRSPIEADSRQQEDLISSREGTEKFVFGE
jgi:hypothetical protein